MLNRNNTNHYIPWGNFKEPPKPTALVYYGEGTTKRLRPLSEAFIKNLNRLDRISELRNDWNGYGADAFSQKLIQRVRKTILALDMQPEIFPTAAGTIQLEYHKGYTEYLEFQISDSYEFEVYIQTSETEQDFRKPFSIQSINEVVNNFYAARV